MGFTKGFLHSQVCPEESFKTGKQSNNFFGQLLSLAMHVHKHDVVYAHVGVKG